MFISREKLNRIICDTIKESRMIEWKIKDALEEWGFGEKEIWNKDLHKDDGYLYVGSSTGGWVYRKFYPHSELERKFNLLLKHLDLEYYRKEIKETNGKEESYVKEGFRKIKKLLKKNNK